MSEIIGTLTDYALMTEGAHAGKYAVRIDDKPYPVLSHVDAFLLRLQKNTVVDVTIKEVDGEQWVSKIKKSLKPAPAGEGFTTADRLKKAGFGTPTTGPAKDEVLSEQEAATLKARADAAAAEKAHNAEMARISKEAAIKYAKEQAERDEALLKEAQQEITAPAGGIAGIVASTKAGAEVLHPAPVTQTVPVTVAPPGYAVPKNYSSDEMLLLRNVIAKGCSEPEFKLLMYMANTYGLDPLLKQIWAVKRSENAPALVFAGRDGMLAIAHRSGQFDGMQSGVVYEGEGKDKKPVSAWCEIWRKDMTHSFKTEVPFSEYNTGFSVWKTNPSAMILKVAEAVCLRKAFSVSGLYSPEEIDTGGN